MQTATLILIAALAFVGAAVFTGWQEEHPNCPATLEIIRYLPLPEPQPIYPIPALPAVTGFTPAAEQPQEEEASSQPAEDASPVRFHQRHRRHWRRR